MMLDLIGVLAIGLIAAFVLSYAAKRGFFSTSSFQTWLFPIRWYHAAIAFAAYFIVILFGLPLLALFFKNQGNSLSSIGNASWLNFLTSCMIALCLGIYVLCLPKGIFKNLWRRSDSNSYSQDFRFAMIAWLVSFPLVIFINQLADYLLHTLFQVPILPDQLAVRFLKMTFQTPLYLFLTVITIVIAAPLIEETMFRGFLQSFIRQHLGPKSAICITSFCFSFFHYSPEQGLANISIIISLFILSCFLGFTYERRGSLAAPIALHGFFNAINVLNLYFLGGFPKGPL